METATPLISVLTGKQRTCPNCNSPLEVEVITYTKGDSREKLIDKYISCTHCAYWKLLSSDPMNDETFNPGRRD